MVADLYVYVTHQSAGGVVGKAWLGSVCNSDASKNRRVSVNAHFGGDQITGSVSIYFYKKNVFVLLVLIVYISLDNCP